MPNKQKAKSEAIDREFAHREQELKPYTSVTGAGETSVSHEHAKPGSDPDYGADNSIEQNDIESFESESADMER